MSLNPLSRRRPQRRSRAKAMALAGLALGGVAALLKRSGAGRLIGLGGGDEEPERSSAPSPGPSNYDIAGPASNTATAVPVPEAHDPETLDEDAEIAAAAAEAANIGGGATAYAGNDPYALADEEQRPLAEAGGGESEGMEQAEAELIEAAEPADGTSDFQRNIEDAIEAQDDPTAGESAEGLDAAGQLIDRDQPGDDQGVSATGSTREPDREETGPGSSSELDERP